MPITSHKQLRLLLDQSGINIALHRPPRRYVAVLTKADGSTNAKSFVMDRDGDSVLWSLLGTEILDLATAEYEDSTLEYLLEDAHEDVVTITGSSIRYRVHGVHDDNYGRIKNKPLRWFNCDDSMSIMIIKATPFEIDDDVETLKYNLVKCRDAVIGVINKTGDEIQAAKMRFEYLTVLLSHLG